MTREALRETARELLREHGDLLSGPPVLRGTEAQVRADALERARERVMGGRRRDVAAQMVLDLER